jgi:hypothetical protein
LVNPAIGARFIAHRRRPEKRREFLILRTVFSENRYPLFGIMRDHAAVRMGLKPADAPAVSRCSDAVHDVTPATRRQI